MKYLAKLYFDVEPTPKQCEIIRTISFSENKRVVISCMTRYGKSWCVSIGVLLYVIFNKNNLL